MLRVALIAAFCVAACTPTKPLEVRVIGVADAPRHEVVFVQVTNPAARPMRLTKLEYSFAAGAEKISHGTMDLAREVPAGAAVVVEIPLDTQAPDKPMTLRGRLTAELDAIVRTFEVSTIVQPEQVAD